MFWQTLHFTDIILWMLTAASTFYIFFFSMIFLFHRRTKYLPSPDGIQDYHSFLVIFPAYGEDRVITKSVASFLQQTYPENKYHLMVVSDHMKAATNEALRQLPVSVLEPCFDNSSKAKSLQYAIDHVENSRQKYDYVIILDADNIVNDTFLSYLNMSCLRGFRAIQCHRCAKNSEGSIAQLDGLSEEINNSIFRKAHNLIGLSSALIGSGMCFEYEWFKSHVHRLSTAGEDRELEQMLLQEHIFIRYEEHIPVFDEKVSNEENFQRQRRRWMSAQINSLQNMLPQLPRAIMTGNINYVDKTLQQMLIPRSMLLVFTLLMSVSMLLISVYWSVKWWLLFLIVCFSLTGAIPKALRKHHILSKVTMLPKLTWKMLKNVRHIDRHNKDFLHTDHY